MRRLILILLAGLGPGLAPARAAHTQVSLILSAATARPGETVLAGLDLKMEPGWHTYWKNPGEAGLPTEIKWTLPPGVTAGDIQWPMPGKLPPAEITTYGYEDEVVLMVPLKLSPDLKPDQALQLQANVTWLECKDSCIPGKDTVAATLNLGGETKASPDAAILEAWQKKVPGPLPEAQWSVHAAWDKSPDTNNRPLLITGRFIGAELKTLRIDTADFFPGTNDNYEIQPATEPLPADGPGFRLRKVVKKYSGDWPQIISGVLTLNGSYGPLNYEVRLGVPGDTGANPAPAAGQISPADTTPAGPVPSLGLMLLYAFIGGLILNIMPCVLPVIALKILGFVGEASSRAAPGPAARPGVCAGGVGVRSWCWRAWSSASRRPATARAGGCSLAIPVFLVSLTTLVLLVALNLFGLYEVSLAGRALNSAGRLASAARFCRGVLQRRAGHRPGHPLHRAVLKPGPGVRLCAERRGDFVDLPDGGPGTGRAVCGAELESGLAEISAQTRAPGWKNLKSAWASPCC